MTRFGKIFFGVLFMVLLFACFHASDVASQPKKEINWQEAVSIEVAWDESTTHITENEGKIMYLLYAKEQDTGGKPWLVKGPIPELICKIRSEDESGFKVGKKYLLGVSTVIYKDKKIIRESDISWSCDENCTNNKPFGVIFTK